MDSTKKLMVGIFVGGCLLLFGVGLFLIGNSNQLFTKSFQVYAEFKKITGIQNGGKVRVAGMDAGTVVRIEVPTHPEGKFRIYFKIIEKLHPLVRQDSEVTIQTDGLLGNKYLQIDAGTSFSAPARENAMIHGKEPFDWGDLMDQISVTVKEVNGILLHVKDQLSATLVQVESAVKSANLLMIDARPHVNSILASAKDISADLHEIIDGVQEGRGTVGALFKDEKLYASVKRSVDQTEVAVNHLRDATASAKKVVAKVEDSEIVPEVQRTVKNLQQITRQVKDAVEKFEAAGGDGGASENLQRTLAGAREAMSDLSDNTEALKHNFFFKGFFRRRGFFDLGALNVTEYRNPRFGKDFKQYRLWFATEDLFRKDAGGAEVLSAQGKAKLDEAMTQVLAFPRNGPLILEGFASDGTVSQQYLAGRRRAVRVQAYIVDQFRLRPAYVGVISLGSDAAFNKTAKDGVGLVSFYK
ncbi:MAG: MlaD family protein [Bryobacteraceae bacterium]|nr:MlaD family protein [Bryobacteraceae bacterium]